MKNQVIRNLKTKGFWRYRVRSLLKYVIVSTAIIMFLHFYYPWSVQQKLAFRLYGLFIGLVEDLLSFTILRV